MKFSKSGGLTILVVFCLSVGFLLGQKVQESVINLEAMKEANLFSVHAAYLRGCVENSPGNWEKCVQGAIKSTKDVRDILDQEPALLFTPPQIQKETNKQPNKPSLEELFQEKGQGIMI